MKDLWNLKYGLIWSEKESEDMINHVLELSEKDFEKNYIYHVDKMDTPCYTFVAPSCWDALELKYNIKFCNKDGSFRPVNEVLQDMYYQEPSNALNILSEIFEYGEYFLAGGENR